MKDALSIASVCRTLPTPNEPSSGVFVARRLAAIAERSDLSVIQPIPCFPFARPLPDWARSPEHVAQGICVSHARMFYVPKFFKGLDGYWLYRSVIEQLAALKRSGRLDFIDAHFAYPDGAGCARAAKRLNVPVAVTLRGVEEDYLHIPSLARKIGDTVRSVDACICVSHSLRELALKLGADENKVHVIHNAVNRHQFAPGDKTKARAALSIDSDRPLIVSVGNLLSVKRHDVLISAFARLSDTESQLVIVGGAMHEPDHPAELKALCDELGVTDRVKFVGRIDESEVSIWLQASDVFALASRREGCCNAILEALASGVPVVTTPVGDNPWFVKDGENGYLAPVGDVEATTHALSQALGRRDWDMERISLGLQVGDWDSVAKALLEIFEVCVAKNKKRTGVPE